MNKAILSQASNEYLKKDIIARYGNRWRGELRLKPKKKNYHRGEREMVGREKTKFHSNKNAMQCASQAKQEPHQFDNIALTIGNF